MLYQSMAFVFGVGLFQCLRCIPPAWLYECIVPLSLGWRFRYGRVVLLCALGFLWAMWRADSVSQARLDPAAQGLLFSVAGLIKEPLSRFATGSGFVLKVHHAAETTGRASF